MITRTGRWLSMFLLLAGLVFANLLAQRFKFRVDLTGDQRYTLSPATQALLDSMPEAATVTAYFTEELPPDLALVRQDFKDLLTEYAARSNGNLVFEFIDPNTDDAKAAQAREEGVRPLLAQTRAKDKAENLQVYMGAVVRVSDRSSVIPVVKQDAGMEWTLSSALRQASVKEKPLIGVLQGHHEPPMQALDQLAVALNDLYEVEPTVIYDDFPINERFSTLLIIDPQDSIPPTHLRRLEEYMARGHGVVVAYSGVQADLVSALVATVRESNVPAWLATHGVEVRPRIIVDLHCGQVQVQQNGLPFLVPIEFPFYPLIDHFGDHPVASGVDVALFQFASPLRASGIPGIRFAPLALTSDHSDTLASPVPIDVRRMWNPAGLSAQGLAIGAAVEVEQGPLTGQRMVVFGNGSFCTSSENGRPVQLPPSNIDLMVNAVDWVTHNTGLLSLRGKAVDYRPIEGLSDAQRTTLKWTNLLLPVLLVAAAGALRADWRRRQRKRRMRPGHVT